MPVVDDLTEAISKFGDALIYDLIKFTAEALWWLIKAVILLAWQVNSIDRWLAANVFPPLVESAGSGTEVAASMTFVMALVLAGLTYMLAIYVRLDVVNPRKAIVWFLAGAMFFQIGPQLYQGFHDMRQKSAAGFFAAGLDGVTNAGDNPFAAFSGVNDADPLVPYDLCDNYGPYFTANPGGSGYYTTIRGTDVALAFLRANGHDVMGYAPPFSSPGGGYCGVPPFAQRELPQWWLENPWVLGGYFFEERNSDSFDDYGAAGRRDSIENAFLGLRRLVAATPLVLMGVVESLIYLLLSLAEGLVFLSFGVALVFSYFNRTEIIALSVIDQMVQLIIQTVVIALMQSMIMGLTFAAATGTSPFLLLGMGTLSLVLTTILLWSGVKAVFNSINKLFSAISAVTGRTFLTPTQAAVGTVGLAAGGALVAAGAGIAGAALAGALTREQSDQPSYSARALRGSGNMFRAGTYAIAAGTGSHQIAQLGHFSTMMQLAARDLVPGRSATTPSHPTSENRTGQPSTIVSRPTQAVPHTPPLRDTIEQVGEELEDAMVAQRMTSTQDRTFSRIRENRELSSSIPGGPREPQVATVPTALGQSLAVLRKSLPGDGPAPANRITAALQQTVGSAQTMSPNQMTAFSAFLNQALKVGLTGHQAEMLVQKVQSVGDQPLPLRYQGALEDMAARRMPRYQAQHEAATLLTLARALPTQLPTTPPPTINVRPQVTLNPQITVQSPTKTEAQAREKALRGHERLSGEGG